MISRRSFLKIAAAAGIVLVTPVQLAALAPIASSIKRTQKLFDFGILMGICAEMTVRNVRYRSAATLFSQSWESLTSVQQEELWLATEAKLLRFVEGKRVDARQLVR